MKKIKPLFIKLSLLFLVCLSFFIFYLVKDEKLDKEPAYWMNYFDSLEEKIDLQENGNVYLLGLDANESEDPYQVGLWKIEQHTRALQSVKEDHSEYKLENRYPLEKKLTISVVRKETCSLQGFNPCITELMNNRALLKSEIEKNPLLLERYWKLAQYEKFTVMYGLIPDEARDSFGVTKHFYMAHEMASYEILLDIIDRNYEDAFTKLQRSIDLNLKIERHFDSADAAIATANLYKELGLAEILIGAEPSVAQGFRTQLDQVLKRDLTFSSLMLPHFYITANQFYKVKGNMKTFHEIHWLRRFYHSLFINPNGMVNRFYKKEILDDNSPAPSGIKNHIGLQIVEKCCSKDVDANKENIFNEVNGNLYSNAYLLHVYLKAQAGESVDLKNPRTGEVAFEKGNKLCYTSEDNNPEPICVIRFNSTQTKESAPAEAAGDELTVERGM